MLMGADSTGRSFEFNLEPYADGRPAPTFRPPAPPREGEEGPHGEDGREGYLFDDHHLDVVMDQEEEPQRGAAVAVCAAQRWERKEPKFVKTDVRTASRFSAKFLNTDAPKGTISELFMLLMPPNWLTLLEQHTNARLTGNTVDDAKTTRGELLRWWGYALALSLNSGVPIERMWAHETYPDDILPPPNMGRFGMTKNRWMRLRARMACGPSDEASLEADPWSFVRAFTNSFNDHMHTTFGPSWLLCLDESMVAWRGRFGEGDPSKCPHRSWVPRKPEPMGCELKSLACAMSGLLLFAEIAEGEQRHARHKWHAEYGHTTSTTLRCTELYHGTQRVVYGDSWFAGVKTAEAMLKHGLYFLGDVKTNTKRYPTEELKKDTGEERGAWAVYASALQIDDKMHPVYATSHRRGESVHCFVHTCDVTLPGDSHVGIILDREAGDGTVQDYVLERKAPKVRVHRMWCVRGSYREGHDDDMRGA